VTLSWISIVRLGLVQMCLGAIVVIATSTLNRLMVVELALPAVMPGLLVALHYGIQISRPKWGFASDRGGRRTRWIVGGMLALALGGIGAASSIAVLAESFPLGLALSIMSYALIGVGVGACGTSLLALLATSTAPERRAAAATITWLMMVAGIAVCAGGMGAALDPYSAERLIWIVAAICAAASLLTCLAVAGVERGLGIVRKRESMPFLEGLREVWSERKTRDFTIFVFLSMTAYFMQELILEPYAGLVFAFTPGQSTTLSGAQNGGVFVGMVSVGVAISGLGIGTLRGWVIVACVGSALSLTAIAALGSQGPGAPLIHAVVLLGFFNGMFAVAAIGSMMALAGQGRSSREGTRMGLWGAGQALAAGFGGLLGAAAVDILRRVMADAEAFGIVFFAEALLFACTAFMAARIIETRSPGSSGVLVGE